MKSKTKTVAGLAALLVVGPAVCGVLYAQRDTPQTSPDATSRTNQAQPEIRSPLPRGKRLVLTDGTFQVVREYSVEGDRVRYWSLERSAWEEIPANLVDWDATRKAESEQVSRDAELKARIRASEVAERTKDINVDRSLEIKPGLFLPDGVGFYALETRQIREMKQNLAVSKRSMGREIGKILSGVPLIPSKMTMEIPEAHATLRFTVAEPEFFMRPADDREPRFRLLRAQVKGGHRLLENISIHMTGEQTHQATDIDFQTWTPARGVFRYTVGQRLEPGEYAFVEMVNEDINAYVWDFGIDAPGTKAKK